MNTEITLHSLISCRIVVQVSIQAYMAREARSTCMLAYVACMIYRSDNLKRGMPKHLYRCYIAYLLGSLGIYNVFVGVYDCVTGNADHLLLPSGIDIIYSVPGIGNQDYQHQSTHSLRIEL